MLLLAIDTATPAVTAGVVSAEPDRARVLAERITVDPRAHGELITPNVLDAVHEAGVTLGNIDAVVCGNGPGPYTGLRAGLATATALGNGLGVPAYPVCSLDAIAADVATDEAFLVVTDARRREVYWAAYAPGGARQDGPDVRRPDELGADTPRAAGHGAALYAEVLGFDVLEPAYPSPRGLVAAAGARPFGDAGPEPLTPLYLRRPHAVEPGKRKRVRA